MLAVITGEFRKLGVIAGEFRMLAVITGEFRMLPVITGEFGKLGVITSEFRMLLHVIYVDMWFLVIRRVFVVKIYFKFNTVRKL